MTSCEYTHIRYAPAAIPKADHYLERWVYARQKWVLLGKYDSYTAAATAMYQTVGGSFMDVMRIRNARGAIVG